MNLYSVEPTLLVDAWDESDAAERVTALLEWLESCPFAEFTLVGVPIVALIEEDAL